jgi:acetyltransferase EpsM
MKKLVIVSAGGTGREMRELLKDKYEIIGFLDDNQKGLEIVGELKDLTTFTEQGVAAISALGSYRGMLRRRQFLERFTLDPFVCFHSDRAFIYDNVSLGKATTVFPFSVISTQVSLGVHCFIYHNCVISHDSRVGDYSIVANSVTISGNVSIGENSYIGAGATILEGRSVGDNSIVAAGATVVRDIPSNSVYLSKDRIKTNRYITNL